MHIHIGEKKSVSLESIMGIFNAETLMMSVDNIHIMNSVKPGNKCVAVDISNKVYSSKVSSFTVIKRDSLTEDVIWRK